MTTWYIKLLGLLPRVNLEVVKEIEATAAFLSTAVPLSIQMSAREIAKPAELTNAGLAR